VTSSHLQSQELDNKRHPPRRPGLPITDIAGNVIHPAAGLADGGMLQHQFLHNGLVHGDKLGAVGKGGFHLDFVDHFWDAFHDVGTG
jgi:hypothetical protein